jgi:hypothetical protein
MEVSREELEESYRQLSDEELLGRVTAGTLTDLALDVAASELRSRGIELPPVEATEESDPSDVVGVEVGDERVDLVTVARFSNPLKANVLRACLESHGIHVFLWGEHLGTTYVFWSVAAGGMRIQVPRSQLAQAQEVIAAWERGELAIDDEPG